MPLAADCATAAGGLHDSGLESSEESLHVLATAEFGPGRHKGRSAGRRSKMQRLAQIEAAQKPDGDGCNHAVPGADGTADRNVEGRERLMTLGRHQKRPLCS